jgi:hypothetical protein
MYAQLPDMLRFEALTGSRALRFLAQVPADRPEAAVVFRELAATAACAGRSSALATEAYVGSDPEEAIGVLVVTDNPTPRATARVLTTCFLTPGAESGARGRARRPASAPCLAKYYYDAVTSGSVDRYFLLVAGTKPWSCDRLLGRHSRFHPQLFDVA